MEGALDILRLSRIRLRMRAQAWSTMNTIPSHNEVMTCDVPHTEHCPLVSSTHMLPSTLQFSQGLVVFGGFMEHQAPNDVTKYLLMCEFYFPQ